MPNPTGTNTKRERGVPLIIRDFPEEVRHGLKVLAAQERTTMREIIIGLCRKRLADDLQKK